MCPCSLPELMTDVYVCATSTIVNLFIITFDSLASLTVANQSTPSRKPEEAPNCWRCHVRQCIFRDIYLKLKMYAYNISISVNFHDPCKNLGL